MYPRGKISGKPAHDRCRDLLRPARWAAIAGTRVAARGLHGIFVRKHTPGRRLLEYRQELIPSVSEYPYESGISAGKKDSAVNAARIPEISGHNPGVLSLAGIPAGDFEEMIAAVTHWNDGMIIARDSRLETIPGLAIVGY